MAQPQPKPLFFETFEDFLDWERLQPRRHDLIDGVPVAMAGGSEAHNIIQSNLVAASHAKLRGGPCFPFTSDMAMKTGARKGRYPDVTIDSGNRNPKNLASPKPVVVIEVLSPETQKEDRTIKLSEYNAVPSISHYVLVEQSEPVVHVYSRGPSGEFLLRPQEIEGLDGTIELPAVELSLTMEEVYERLNFDAALDREAELPTRHPW